MSFLIDRLWRKADVRQNTYVGWVPVIGSIDHFVGAFFDKASSFYEQKASAALV
jgi:hypothetical protein